MNGFVKPDELQELSEQDASDLQRLGVIAMNPDRTLPLWFDGRFLTARDLNRQQSYFLSRHGSLGRSIGNGVIEGLEVRLGEGSGLQDTIRIAAGQGLAFDGAHIHLPSEMTINLADLSVQGALNAQLGLSAHPSPPLNSRSGLFVLSLRPVEYTANQTTSFPTTVTGERTVHMGDKVEAVAATLTPFAPTDLAANSLDARADAAHRIFATGKIDGLPGYALPLAMLSLRYGAIEWIDIDLVRRDLVTSKRSFLGLGLAQDQLRLAHFQQYRTALSDVMDHYEASNQPARFPAEQHFKLLPPAGPMPADAVDPAAMAQVFFPGEVEVELSVIPDDELPALIEESFDLPPIDLTRPVEERDSLSVMIVAPMPRHALRSKLVSLQELSKPLRPLSMLGKGPQKPLDRLGTMKISLADAAAHRAPSESVAAEEWASVVAELTNFKLEGDAGRRTLWYMRRRTLRRSADLESVLVAIGNTDPADDTDVPSPVDPVPEPTPEPTPTPTPDPLFDEARAALLKLAGFGELTKIAEVQLRRVNKSVAEVFAKAVLETPLVEDTISTTALVARMSESAANARAKLDEQVESILKSDVKGRSLLSSGLIGQGVTEVSAERFKLLQFFLVEDAQLERTANALPKLKPELQRELTLKLAELVKAQENDAVAELVKEIEKQGEEADRPAPTPSPTPTPTPTPEPSRDPVAEENARREAESRKAADRLIASLPHSGDQARMKTALNKATTPQREELVKLLDNAKVSTSRIATGAALNALTSGGNLTNTHIQRVRAINSTFVKGINALEDRLLKVEEAPAPAPRPAPAPAPRPSGGIRGGAIGGLAGLNINRGAGARVFEARRDPAATARILAGVQASTVDKRVSLLSQASSLPAVAKYGNKNRAKAAKLNAFAKDVVPALDKSGATAASVDSVIRKSLERNG
ncbi:hypothetical protein [Parerythrobacter aestuarii]|uniref:hypothetical protein n=1 Tax=Parerythrobacter aestuarii TaxID=3020909 RepID=UPI0024DE6084|nr:hypothetical protein [Parerythrobacter aestuarii]